MHFLASVFCADWCISSALDDTDDSYFTSREECERCTSLINASTTISPIGSSPGWKIPDWSHSFTSICCFHTDWQRGASGIGVRQSVTGETQKYIHSLRQKSTALRCRPGLVFFHQKYCKENMWLSKTCATVCLFVCESPRELERRCLFF